jgi:hypothetical protein
MLNRTIIGNIDGHLIFLDSDEIECVSCPITGDTSYDSCLLYLSDYLLLSSLSIFPPFYVTHNNGHPSVCYRKSSSTGKVIGVLREATQRVDRLLLDCAATCTVEFINGDVTDLRRSNLVYSHKGKPATKGGQWYIVVTDFD